MNVNDIKTFLGVLNQANPPVLLLLAASVVCIVLGFSWVVATYLRNKELSRLIEAVNHNTNSVNLLLELTKLIFGAKFPKIQNNKGDTASDGSICEELVGDIQKTQKDVSDIM